MRHSFILLMVMNLFYTPLKAQINIDVFTNAIIKQCKILQKGKLSDINAFMKYGYIGKPDLNSDSINAIPIYSIFLKKEYKNKKKNKDSLFVYIDTKSLCIENVIFSKNNMLYAVAHSKYLNMNRQPVGKGSNIEKQLYKIILEYNPDMICSLSQSNRIYLFLKGQQLGCFLFNEKQNNFIFKKPDELLEELNDDDIYFLINKTEPTPLIYCK